MQLHLLLLAAALLSSTATDSPLPLDVYGDWVIPPDEAGGPDRGIVTIAPEDGVPVGIITAVGEAFTDDPQAAAAIGMRILWGFEADDDEWEDGTILDPEKDKTYRAKIKREGDTLSVKGCVAFFCKEQVWLAANTAELDEASPE